VADWHWECDPDDLLDGLPPEAVRAVEELARELTVRDSMIFLAERHSPERPQASESSNEDRSCSVT
jgi:hypothetical protein